MNDPWDVKSVRLSGHYVSCMKINGVPLLPPLLSKECRKEMQYYKLLAKEVEKRITLLEPYVIDSEAEVSDTTDAVEIPICVEDFPVEDMNPKINININNKTTVINKINSPESPTKLNDKSIKSPLKDQVYNSVLDSSHLDVDFNTLNIDKNVDVDQKHSFLDKPERDCNSEKQKEVLLEYETSKTPKKSHGKPNHFIESCDDSSLFSDFSQHKDGPCSMSKSFTGSLKELYSNSPKESQAQTLIRQHSYTILHPSPQLLAHLERQSYNTGVEMTRISMSESLSNLSSFGSPEKKRRSWDLESAKVKWSSMARELKDKELSNVHKGTTKTITPNSKKIQQNTSSKPNLMDRNKRISPAKPTPKSEPIAKPWRPSGPVKNGNSDRAAPKHTVAAAFVKKTSHNKEESPKSTFISDTEDPATKVKELYDKVQKQQLLQMASLVEKQKREQYMLQQLFEEQNNLLYRQLKTICPKSPVETKEAWSDKYQIENNGPVSLSQLINHSTEQMELDSPISTINDTASYINYCDDILKKSRNITGSLKKDDKIPTSKSARIDSRSQAIHDGSKTRTHSPVSKSAISRRLNYESATSDLEYEPILTDRTNDTLADLNVTFPSDSEVSNNTMVNAHGRDSAVRSKSLVSNVPYVSADTAISNMERTIKRSMTANKLAKMNIAQRQYTPRESAAASKIVAFAKGFLVRRLMRTEKVQGTVQTIKDALLCALQLHQDREGIRGADVDLHRRLIQQITAACYSLHDTFVASSPAERCAVIASDRERRRSLANRAPPKPFRHTNI